MKTLLTRLHRLEVQLAPRLDENGMSIVAQIREVRLRRLAAEGKEPEPERKRHREDYYDAQSRPLSSPEIMRNLRSRRFKEERKGEEMQMRRASTESLSQRSC